MFDFPPLSEAPPASVEEALLQAKQLFSQAGLAHAEVVVTQPPGAGESLRWACLEASIPAASLEAVAAKAAEAVPLASTGTVFERVVVGCEALPTFTRISLNVTVGVPEAMVGRIDGMGVSRRGDS